MEFHWRHAVLAAALMTGSLLLAGCGGGGGESGKLTVETSLGTLVITEVQSSDRWPPGCDFEAQPQGESEPDCEQAPEGHQILVVSLEAGDAVDISHALGWCFEAYVVADDGTRAGCERSTSSSDWVRLGFAPPTSAHDFELFLPDSPPVHLGK